MRVSAPARVLVRFSRSSGPVTSASPSAALVKDRINSSTVELWDSTISAISANSPASFSRPSRLPLMASRFLSDSTRSIRSRISCAISPKDSVSSRMPFTAEPGSEPPSPIVPGPGPRTTSTTLGSISPSVTIRAIEPSGMGHWPSISRVTTTSPSLPISRL